MAPSEKGRIYLNLDPPTPHLRVEEPNMPCIRYLLGPGAQDPSQIPFPLSGEGRAIIAGILRDWGLRIIETLVETKEEKRSA